MLENLPLAQYMQTRLDARGTPAGVWETPAYVWEDDDDDVEEREDRWGALCECDEDWEDDLTEEEQRRIEDGMEEFEERRRRRIAESLEY